MFTAPLSISRQSCLAPLIVFFLKCIYKIILYHLKAGQKLVPFYFHTFSKKQQVQLPEIVILKRFNRWLSLSICSSGQGLVNILLINAKENSSMADFAVTVSPEHNTYTFLFLLLLSSCPSPFDLI